MYSKIFTITLLLLSSLSFFAQNPVNDTPPKGNDAYQQGTCNVPAPIRLEVQTIGVGWVKLAWTAVPNASQYRVQIIDNHTGKILDTRFLPNNTTTSILSTKGSTGQCHAKIWSICENGNWQDNNFTASSNFDSIIIEVVVSQLTIPNNPIGGCVVGLGLNGGCSFPWNATETPFRVKYNGYIRYFSLDVLDLINWDRVHFNMEGESNNSPIKFMVIGMPGSQKIIVTFQFSNGNNEKIAEMEVLYQVGGSGALFKTSGNAVVEKVIDGGQPIGFSSNDEGATSDRNEVDLVVQPNPFSDFLQFQCPTDWLEKPMEMILMDQTGQIKMTKNEILQNTNYKIQIENYLPPGFYYLEIKCNGLKKIKKLIRKQL